MAEKPKEYFDVLWDLPEDRIDYETAPKTSASDWKDAEELIPIAPEEIQKLKKPA